MYRIWIFLLKVWHVKINKILKEQLEYFKIPEREPFVLVTSENYDIDTLKFVQEELNMGEWLAKKPGVGKKTDCHGYKSLKRSDRKKGLSPPTFFKRYFNSF